MDAMCDNGMYRDEKEMTIYLAIGKYYAPHQFLWLLPFTKC